jgi:hypothetical protein
VIAPGDEPDPHRGGGGKAGAPIELSLQATPLAGTGDVDRFQVVLTATPRRDLDRVELSIDGRPSQVATATAGAVSRVSATIEVARGEGKDVIATAAMLVGGRRMGAAAQLRVGAPAADPPAGTLLQLPDGTTVQEVRP